MLSMGSGALAELAKHPALIDQMVKYVVGHPELMGQAIGLAHDHIDLIGKLMGQSGDHPEVFKTLMTQVMTHKELLPAFLGELEKHPDLWPKVMDMGSEYAEIKGLISSHTGVSGSSIGNPATGFNQAAISTANAAVNTVFGGASIGAGRNGTGAGVGQVSAAQSQDPYLKYFPGGKSYTPPAVPSPDTSSGTGASNPDSNTWAGVWNNLKTRVSNFFGLGKSGSTSGNDGDGPITSFFRKGIHMLCGDSIMGKILDFMLTAFVLVIGLISNGIKGIVGLITGQTQKDGNNALDNAGKKAMELAHNAGDKIAEGYQSVARGIRNYNPGNLICTPKPYNGTVGADNEGFARFNTLQDGANAAMKEIRKRLSNGIDDVYRFAESWAPGSDPRNDPTKYALGLKASVGDTHLEDSRAVAKRVFLGLNKNENGKDAGRVSDEVIENALDAAGYSKQPSNPTLSQDNGFSPLPTPNNRVAAAGKPV